MDLYIYFDSIFYSFQENGRLNTSTFSDTHFSQLQGHSSNHSLCAALPQPILRGNTSETWTDFSLPWSHEKKKNPLRKWVTLFDWWGSGHHQLLCYSKASVLNHKPIRSVGLKLGIENFGEGNILQSYGLQKKINQDALWICRKGSLWTRKKRRNQKNCHATLPLIVSICDSIGKIKIKSTLSKIHFWPYHTSRLSFLWIILLSGQHVRKLGREKLCPSWNDQQHFQLRFFKSQTKKLHLPQSYERIQVKFLKGDFFWEEQIKIGFLLSSLSSNGKLCKIGFPKSVGRFRPLLQMKSQLINAKSFFYITLFSVIFLGFFRDW